MPIFDNADPLDEIPIDNMLNSEEETGFVADPLNIKEEPINSHDVGMELDRLVCTRTEVIDEDLIMIFDDEKCFAPQKEILLKRNDVFSGTIPYEEDVSGDKMYFNHMYMLYSFNLHFLIRITFSF